MDRWFSVVRENLWLVEASFAVTMTAIFLLVWMKFCHLAKKRTEKSANIFADIIIFSIGAPLTVLILVLGLQQTLTAIIGVFPQYQNIKEFSDAIRTSVMTVILFWTLLRLIGAIERYYRRRNIVIGDRSIDQGTVYSLFRVLRAAIFIIAVLTVIEGFGISISGILAFGGIGGVIIGFAAKDTLANFFSGMMIYWERPFVIGDWIRCPDMEVEGVVEKIGWRMTQIRTFDQRPLYIPNALFTGHVIENPQRMTNRRIYEYMGLRYEDIDKMETVLVDVRKLLGNHPSIDQQQIIMVNFDRFGASSIDFFIYAMTRTTCWEEFHQIKGEVLLTIAAIVKKHGAEFAFPTRTIHHQYQKSPNETPSLPPVSESGGQRQ